MIFNYFLISRATNQILTLFKCTPSINARFPPFPRACIYGGTHCSKRGLVFLIFTLKMSDLTEAERQIIGFFKVVLQEGAYLKLLGFPRTTVIRTIQKAKPNHAVAAQNFYLVK